MNPAALKAQTNFKHAVARGAERYGLAEGDVAQIQNLIRQSSVKCVPLAPDPQTKNRTWYAVEIDGRWIPVVFDHATWTVVTVLPEWAVDKYRHSFEPKIEREVVSDFDGLSVEDIDQLLKECRKEIADTKVQIKDVDKDDPELKRLSRRQGEVGREIHELKDAKRKAIRLAERVTTEGRPPRFLAIGDPA